MNETPSQAGPEGIRYDFQDGCRVSLPPGEWHIELIDQLTQTVLFAGESAGGIIHSTKKYYVPFIIRISRHGQIIFEHKMDLTGKEILIDVHLGGVGDHLAWMGHVEAFAERHACHVRCLVRSGLAELFAGQHERITITDDETCLEDSFYARYKVLIFFNDTERNYQPTDYRQVGLSVSGAYILGLPPRDRRPRINIAPGGRPIPEPYVCIATQATGHNKYWNNPTGWQDTIRFLTGKGYRIICIDRDRVTGQGTVWHHMPHGVEDMTGLIPLSERARWLSHADFFIGLSSGLSWLAWSAGSPVVMISGFTEPFNEFETPYRVINRNTCNGCSNDVTLAFDRMNYFWCPRHANTDRDFECSKLISSKHVEQVIDNVIQDRQESPAR